MEISNYDANSGLVAGNKPADYSALAKKYGMEIISSHARAKFDVKDEAGTLAAWGKLFDDHKIMGCKYVVLPMNLWSGTVEGVKSECDLMNKNGYEDWFVEMEDKMTPEEREQSKGMMDAMKQIQARGGTMQDLMAELSKNRPQGGPPAGFGAPQDPKVVAEKLKTSLEGIKESADFLMKSDFEK